MLALGRVQIGLILVLSQIFFACQSKQPTVAPHQRLAPIESQGQNSMVNPPVVVSSPRAEASRHLDENPPVLDASVLQVSVGSGYSCAINIRQELYCWGSNRSGRLGGQGPFEPGTLAIHVSPGTTYRSVSAGYDHTCAITTGGELQCWGDSRYLGAGSSDALAPNTIVTVDAGTQYQSVALGMTHTCGVTIAGVLKCWARTGFVSTLQDLNLPPGINQTASEAERSVPQSIHANLGHQFTEVSVGFRKSCAVSSNTNRLYCWGDNSTGNLLGGRGQLRYENSPVRVDVRFTYQKVSLGNQFACGLTTDHALRCWGVVPGYSENHSSHAHDVDPGVRYQSMSVGADHFCGVTEEGTLKCAGNNRHGQLGIGSVSSQPSGLAVVAEGTTYREVAAGYQHTCGITTDGLLQCWGDNRDG